MTANQQNMMLNQSKKINQSIPVKKKVLGIENTIIASPSATLSPTPLPKGDKRLIKLGIVVDDYRNTTGELSTVQQQLGKPFSTVSIYKQFGLPTNDMISSDDLAYIHTQRSNVLIAWEPWNPQEGIHQSTDYLQEIMEGKQDTYIKNFAQSVKSYAGPVTIRFGHEMNGDWYPWGKRPTEYTAAYRRIVLLFKDAGVTNVSWMWSINANPLDNLASYYPGNEYVDIIGIDGFNFGTTQSRTTWQTFDQIFQPVYNYLTQQYSKPIIISETASAEQGGNKPEWIQNMFASMTTKMPQVQEIIWFDLIKETDWRINSTPASFSSFKSSI